MYNIVLPCMMMSVLTLLVFCMPPESGEKIALGVTVLLAFSVFMLAIAEKMPETSDSVPLIGGSAAPNTGGSPPSIGGSSTYIMSCPLS